MLHHSKKLNIDSVFKDLDEDREQCPFYLKSGTLLLITLKIWTQKKSTHSVEASIAYIQLNLSYSIKDCNKNFCATSAASERLFNSSG